MPLNLPGILVPFQLIIYPRLVVPSLIVKDIRHLDFPALKRAGYRGAVFDKDNCLTIPYKDTLVPELEEAWKTCRETFGEGNVIIVSNSAGTGLDAGGIQAESVQHHLQVPVLFHASFKPAYSCISAIQTYFSSLPRPIRSNELIIVGDRIFTDIVMANRIQVQGDKRPRLLMQSQEFVSEKKDIDLGSLDSTSTESTVDLKPSLSPPGPLAVWTTGVWEKESMFMRCMESQLVKSVEKWTTPKPPHSLDQWDTSQFIRHLPPPEPPKRTSVFSNLVSRFRTS
ncbi:mitochondrial PGP phosphatase-domain-containing protein [Crepidotus variabilis]|uniref:Mitochondrial PGP phosphatase-domain-containing protein n=1 Tax=Crepidotus variabilis TaxID=179855 RepID=A0A9P6EHK7_9AGAR|nr:mitochondrial PGP phosphatase-domain-containing protein [Crepidotus variabilis]